MTNNTAAGDDRKCYPAERNRRRRGHDFYAGLSDIPALYSTESTACDDKTIHAHYFVGGADWYIAELDPCTMEAFGWARIQHGEWGYIDLTELERLKVTPGFVVERDLHWTPKPFKECVGPLDRS